MTNIKDILKNIISGELKHVSKEILDEMIENIGSTNPVLRDKLIYIAFCTLIVENRLEKQQVEYILSTLLKKKSIMLNIDRPVSDAVFTRSFTTLVYAAILEYDSAKQLVNQDLIRKVINETHMYMERESDFRGHVEHKGWAHAVAHGADLLDSLIKHPVSTEDDALKILQHIARFLTISQGYQDEEEERLAYAFVTLTKHHLSEAVITEWMDKLKEMLMARTANASGELQPYYAQAAFKSFLKSSYFFLEKEALETNLKETIKKMIIQMIY